MNSRDFATRRRFFLGAGAAALAAPAALGAVPGAASNGADEGAALEARLAALEDATALRELQREHARQLSARELHDIAIEIAGDRRTATARATCLVVIESPIEAPGCTLVDMARAQGEGVLRRSERRMLEQTFVRRDGVWKMDRAELREPR